MGFQEQEDTKVTAGGSSILEGEQNPSTGPTLEELLMVAISWSTEENAESTWETGPRKKLIDVFDGIGVLLCLLDLEGAEDEAEIDAAHSEYVRRQEERQRPLDVPHQEAISAILSSMRAHPKHGWGRQVLSGRDPKRVLAAKQALSAAADSLKAARTAPDTGGMLGVVGGPREKIDAHGHDLMRNLQPVGFSPGSVRSRSPINRTEERAEPDFGVRQTESSPSIRMV